MKSSQFPSNNSVENITQRLLEKYKEYEQYPVDKFRSLVSQAVDESLTNESGNSSSLNSNVKVLNLNQTLSNSYVRSASGSSKRQRPIDYDSLTSPSLFDNVNDTTNDDFASSVQNIQNHKSSMTPSETVEKRKTPRKLDSNATKAGKDIKLSDRKLNFLQSRPSARLSSLAGIDSVLSQVQELVFYPVKYPHVYKHLGVQPPCGLLLHGPSGCGKTTLAFAIAGELNLPFFKASGPDLVGGTTGESEEKVREIFQAALDSAPSVIFIDSLDVIAGKKDSTSRGMDRRIVAQLFDSIDDIIQTDVHDNVEPNESVSEANNICNNNSEVNTSTAVSKTVILIAATNKPDSIDPGVRGRFSREISLPVPDAHARTKILELASSSMRLADDVNLTELGKLTPGFVGADLHALVREAGMIAVTRIVSSHVSEENFTLKEDNCSLSDNYIMMNDLIQASKSVQPTAKREGFAVVPNVTWNDVGALAEVREELLHNVLEPIAFPDRFKKLGIEVPAGVLFFGPPGCGKTLLAKAIANQSGANFISVKGPELLNMYVGESESRVRQVFSRARSSTPCVIFFDELDALCPKRGSGADGSNVSERVVNQLLTELDGLEVRKDVYIIAATNRLELIDDAILRPGRLGKLLYVPLPTSSDRIAILRALVSKSISLGSDVNIEKIAIDNRAEGFTGADLASLVREAGLAVVREWRETHQHKEKDNQSVIPGDNVEMISEELTLSSEISARHFEAAFSRVRPSVSIQDRRRYERVHHNIKQGMGAIQALKEASYYFSSITENTYV